MQLTGKRLGAAWILLIILAAPGDVRAQVVRIELEATPGQVRADGKSEIQVVVRASDAVGTPLAGAALALGANGGQFLGPLMDHGDGSYSVMLQAPKEEDGLLTLDITATLADGSLPTLLKLPVLQPGALATATTATAAKASSDDSSSARTKPRANQSGTTQGTRRDRPQRSNVGKGAGKESSAGGIAAKLFPPVVVDSGPRSSKTVSGQRFEAEVGFILGQYNLDAQPCAPTTATGCAAVPGNPSEYHFIQTEIAAPNAPAIGIDLSYFPVAYVGPWLRYELLGYGTDFPTVSDSGEPGTFRDNLHHLSVGAQGQFDPWRGRLFARLRLGYHLNNTMLFRRVVDPTLGILAPRYERLWLHDFQIGVGGRFHLFDPLWIHADYDISISGTVGGVSGHRVDIGASYTMVRGLYVEIAFHSWTRGFAATYSYPEPIPPGIAEALQRGDYHERDGGIRIGVGYRF